MGWYNDGCNNCCMDSTNEGGAMKGLFVILVINIVILLMLLDRMGFWEWMYKLDFWL
jgi:hypothetical protein